MKHNLTTITLIKETRTYCPTLTLNARGKVVIGWEHVLRSNKQKAEFSDSAFCAEEAEKLLIKDLKIIDAKLSKLITANLTQKQYNAIISLCYDISVKTFKESGILELINNYQFTEATGQLRKWNTYLNEKSYKLAKLRKIEISLLTTTDY